MKRILIILSLLLLIPSSLSSQNSTTRFFSATGYENLTVDTTVGGVSLNSTKRQFAELIVVTVSCASGTSCPIRVLSSPSDTVTTSVGLVFDYGMSFSLYSNINLVRFRAIRSGATSAVLNIQYYQ